MVDLPFFDVRSKIVGHAWDHSTEQVHVYGAMPMMALIYGTVPLLINGGSFSKASAPPLFLEDENLFQKSTRVVHILLQFRQEPREPIFEKCSHLRKKDWVFIFFAGLY